MSSECAYAPCPRVSVFQRKQTCQKKYVWKKNVEAVRVKLCEKGRKIFSSLEIVLLYRPQLNNKSQRSSIGRIAEGLIDSVSYWVVISGWVFNFNALT